jgi:hypothetical protein
LAGVCRGNHAARRSFAGCGAEAVLLLRVEPELSMRLRETGRLVEPFSD